jgi:hypothetical protein
MVNIDTDSLPMTDLATKERVTTKAPAAERTLQRRRPPSGGCYYKSPTWKIPLFRTRPYHRDLNTCLASSKRLGDYINSIAWLPNSILPVGAQPIRDGGPRDKEPPPSLLQSATIKGEHRLWLVTRLKRC